jgi:integrase
MASASVDALERVTVAPAVRHGSVRRGETCGARTGRDVGHLLGGFLDRYFSKRTDVKPNTLTVWGHTRRCLLEYFGADRALDTITEGDADEWRLFLIEQGLSDSTIRKRCGFAKQFLESAVKLKLIPSNPFAHLKSAARGNAERFYFVTRAEAEAVLSCCPDAQWRLLFALARFGGLRTPSEAVALKWGHVDWERERITVPSPKTEHHDGHESRIMPLFPELRPFLEEAFGYKGLRWQDYVEVDPRYFRPTEVDHLEGDASKARQKLGWRPSVGFTELVRMMVDHDVELARQVRTLRDAGHTVTRRGAAAL